MKVTRDTPDQLIIENNPVWLAILISIPLFVFLVVGIFTIKTDLSTGLVFVVGSLIMGVVFNLAFIRRTQLILDRSRNLVELRRRSMLGYKKRTWELGYLDRVVIQSSNSGDSTTYRAAMVFSDGMDAGTHPITLVYSSGSGADRAAGAINRWLDSDTPTS